uniref:RANBP2 like and GRIP domain containing 1 n=1 Tax=Homo sapiens TaxID=9606 RepID=A0A286YEQ5_HUMAN
MRRSKAYGERYLASVQGSAPSPGKYKRVCKQLSLSCQKK